MSHDNVIRGKLRVDARRALAKLREHLLVDPDLYLTEIVRGFVATGAKEVEVAWDADDIWLGAKLAPPSVKRVVHLFDWLLSSGSTDKEHALRLLALGVNAALGLHPRFIDIYVGTEPATRVRFSRRVLEGSGPDGLPPLPEAKELAPPKGRPAQGLLVHVRKRPGWQVLKRAAVGGSHREVDLLATAVRDLPLPISGLSIMPHPYVLRAPMELPQARRAHVELAPLGNPARFEYLEQGVRLVEQAWTPKGCADVSGLPLPVRAVVDARALPTNASRSALVEDSRLILDARDAANHAFHRAVHTLAEGLLGDEDTVTLIDNGDAEPQLKSDLLGAVVCHVVEAVRQGLEVPDQLDALLDLPLFRDAAGTPRAVRDFAFREAIWVMRGDQPASPELAPWMQNVLWLRGELLEHCLQGVRLADGSGEYLQRASLGLARRQRWLQHPPLELSVPRGLRELARCRVHFVEGATSGLEAEVALLSPDTTLQASRVRIWEDERVFESMRIDSGMLPLPLDVALRWRGVLGPSFDFDAIERTPQLSLALARAALIGVGLVNDLLETGSLPDEQRRAVAKGALGTVAAIQKHEPTLLVEGLSDRFGQLHRAPAFADVRSGRWWSLARLEATVISRRTLCVVAPDEPPGQPADDRPVVAASDRDRQTLEALLGARLIPYARGLRRRPSAAQESAELDAELEQALAKQGLNSAVPRLRFEVPDARGVIAVAKASVLRETHAGVPLSELMRPPLIGPRVIVIADHRLVPTPEWDGVLWRPGRYWWRIERDLIQAVLDALEGEESALEPESQVHVDSPLIAGYLVESLWRLRRRVEELKDQSKRQAELAQAQNLIPRIENARILTWVGPDGAPARVSPKEFERVHDPAGAVPMLRQAPGFETGEFRPLLVTDAGMLQALSALYTELAPAEERLEVERSKIEQRRALARHMDKPELAADEPCPLSDPQCPALTRQGDSGGWPVTTTVALPSEPLYRGAESIEVALNNRSIVRLAWNVTGLPVSARVDVRNLKPAVAAAVLSKPDSLDLKACVKQVALELAATILAAKDPALDAVQDARCLGLLSALLDDDDGFRDDLLSAAMAWPTLQGPGIRLKEAVRADGSIWYCRFDLSPWPTGEAASDLDAPVLRTSTSASGSVRRELLHMLFAQARDVSEAAAALAARRRTGGKVVAPQIEGPPRHPLLRMKLDEIGVQLAVGEIEIIDDDTSSVTLSGLDDVPREVSSDLVIPMRASLRWERADDTAASKQELLREIVHCVSKRLVTLGDQLDELPDFVRVRIRTLICRRLTQGAPLLAGAEELAVFPTILGAHYSLSEMGDSFRFTSLDPPFPERAYRTPIFYLSEEEVDALKVRMRGRDATKQLLRYRNADLRKQAPQIESVEIPTALRAQHLVSRHIELGSLRGEVGVCHPSQSAAERGIHLHTDRRPLCEIPDSASWPMYAVVNDDSLRPNLDFTAPSPKTREVDIAAQVAEVGMAALREELEAHVPEGVPHTWLSGPATDGSTLVTGCLWLTPKYSSQHQIGTHLRGDLLARHGGVYLDRVGIDGIVPVGGNLLIDLPDPQLDQAQRAMGELTGMPALSPNAREAVASLALAVAVDLLQAHAPSWQPEDVELYTWHLALLGAPLAAELTTASGQVVTAAMLIELLQQRHSIWFTRGDGSSFGEFPEGGSEFVLDAQHPAVRVLSRVSPGSLKELGGLPTSSANPFGGEEQNLGFVALAAEAPGGDPKDALSQLGKDLKALGLTGSPVKNVRSSSDGPAFEYRARGRELIVNLEHPALAQTLPHFLTETSVRAVITSAAVAEINRALGSVSDAEEQRVVVELLISL